MKEVLVIKRTMAVIGRTSDVYNKDRYYNSTVQDFGLISDATEYPTETDEAIKRVEKLVAKHGGIYSIVKVFK